MSQREQLQTGLKIPSNEPFILLQTCDRTECYAGKGDIPREVAEHLFKVVSGLESSLIGECAIQGQVKKAYQEAASERELSSSLHRLFQTALSVGKKVRTQSAISHGAISHSQAAIECLKQEQVPLKNALITILGVNKLNEDVIRFLNAGGAKSIFIGNRHLDKATALAEKYDCKAFQLEQLKEVLAFTDVLITATSAPHVLVRPEHFHNSRKIVVLDLAFPRDVDKQVASIPGVTLFNLEDIKQRVNQNMEARRHELSTANRIIEEEVNLFCHRFNTPEHTV